METVAIILAAGQGTRLRPLTDEIPKCLLEVAGHPILAHQLHAITEAGISDITIAVGYRPERIREFASSRFPHAGIHYVLNDQYNTTGNFYTASLAADAVEPGRRVLMIGGDAMF